VTSRLGTGKWLALFNSVLLFFSPTPSLLPTPPSTPTFFSFPPFSSRYYSTSISRLLLLSHTYISSHHTHSVSLLVIFPIFPSSSPSYSYLLPHSSSLSSLARLKVFPYLSPNSFPFSTTLLPSPFYAPDLLLCLPLAYCSPSPSLLPSPSFSSHLLSHFPLL
jgi:hypothetical protein